MGGFRPARTLALTAGAALIGGGVLRLVAGARWFELYGVAAVVLAVLPAVSVALWQGLAARGRSPWLSLLVVVPAAVTAIGQIVFWLAFFSSPTRGIQLGMGRMMVAINAGWAVWAAVALYAAIAAWVVWRAVRRESVAGDS